MQVIVLCTGNPGKIAEIRALLPDDLELRGLQELGMPSDLPETGDTLELNAVQKARYVFDRTGLPCLADDSGLEVDALGGAPGVHSAHYAGNARDAVANMQRLLAELGDGPDRTARFRTVLALVDREGEHLFMGEVPGTITTRPIGTGGFGYDPIFIPMGFDRTFAEMTLAEKNTLSHRARAIAGFTAWLEARRSLPNG